MKPTVKEIRKELSMTQDKFAKVIGVHKNLVSEWERELRNPSIKNQRKIYDFCKENNIDVSFD